MFRIKKNKCSIPVMAAAVIIALFAGETSSAWAWRSLPPAYWGGPVYRVPPRGYRTVWYGRNPYYYSGGWFYRRGAGRLVIAAPPAGIVVQALPLGFATLAIGGLTYYELNGVYYRQAPEGYVVVDPPADTPQPYSAVPDTGEQVVVQIDLLNVRSGPGFEKDIVTQVNRGTAVKVIGSVPDWYYVELNGGVRGWVMQKFVIPVKPAPQG